MHIVPVIFEDHNLVRMRPLSWSTPVFELRCGMFNTRERVGLCRAADQGVLLGRAMLGGLHRASGWSWGPASISADDDGDRRYLFLSGALALDFSLVRGLLDGAPQEADFSWVGPEGLMAALVSGPGARALAAHWEKWEQECAQLGTWRSPAQTPPPWRPDHLLPPAGSIPPAGLKMAAPRWIWDTVAGTADAIAGDLAFVLEGHSFAREPFGIVPLAAEGTPVWADDTILREAGDGHPGRLYCGRDVHLAPGTALDTANGPIILDNGVRVMPHCYLEGPLYIGPGSLVKPGARIFGESSFGIVNRLAGEIGESTFGDFANKQHDGFIGHAVLGSWINLGALTTCSDLKNNYGEIRVDLGAGETPTGLRFIGLMMGDHAKTAIGSLFNTGTVVGFASNIFGGPMPPKYVGNFRWGGQAGDPAYAVEKAVATAEMVMARRGCRFTEAHGAMFRHLAG